MSTSEPPQSLLPRETPEKTFQEIRSCLRKTNTQGRQEFIEELGDDKGKLAKLKLFLFLHPNSVFLILFIDFLVILGVSLIARALINSIVMRLILLLIILVLYLAIPVFSVWNTPKFRMEWDERWRRVLRCYLDNTKIDPIQAERNIKRAILHYKREGVPVKFIVDLLWGSIFIGCLPDPAFQKALITISPTEIFNANWFGALCMLILPFLYAYYFSRYEIPVAWMENVEVQFELGEPR